MMTNGSYHWILVPLLTHSLYWVQCIRSSSGICNGGGLDYVSTVCATSLFIYHCHYISACLYIINSVDSDYSNPVQGQTTMTFRGRSRRNKEDVNEVLYQEDIEVSIHMYSHSPNDLQHTLC